MSAEEQKNANDTSSDDTHDSGSLIDPRSDQKPPNDQEANPTSQKNKTPSRIKNFLKNYRIREFLKNNCLEILALIVVICYTRYAGQQVATMNRTLWEMQQQTEVIRAQALQTKIDAAKQLIAANQSLSDSKTAFQRDQRPYVWLQDAPPEFQKSIMGPGVDGRFGWNVFISNYGKTPAIHLCREIHVVTGKDALKKVVNIEHGTCEKFEGGILPPGKIDFSTAYTVEKPTVTDIQGWLDTNFGLVVYGRIDYGDSLGGEYHSQFCEARLRNGALSDCPQHNHIQ